MDVKRCQSFAREEFTERAYYSKVIEYLKDHKITSSLDVGACSGEVTKVLLERIPTLKRCVLIEPILSNYEFIVESFKGDSRVEVLHRAMFYGDDEVSLGKIPSVHTNAGGGSIFSFIEPEICKAVTLEELGMFDFIKIDVEGSERNIIENSKILKDISFIEIEFHHYDDELQSLSARPAFLKKNLPNHKIILDGGSLDKNSSVFLSKI